MPAFLWSKHILWLEDIIILGYMDIYTSLLQSVVSLPNPLQAARWFGIRVKRRLKIWDCCTESQRPEQTRFLSVCVTDKNTHWLFHTFSPEWVWTCFIHGRWSDRWWRRRCQWRRESEFIHFRETLRSRNVACDAFWVRWFVFVLKLD